jgi:phage baseplate assembly protein W
MDELGREFLGRGWAFPIALQPDTGRVAEAAYEEDIRQSIRIILGTAKGERVMRPDFGCGIHDLVFAAINTQVIARLKRDVESALRTYEARIDVLRIEVDQSRLTNGRLDVIIDYRVRATNQVGNYVYPFYFKEAS